MSIQNKKLLAPLFGNVIAQKNVIANKNQIIEPSNSKNSQLGENLNKITFKEYLSRNISFIKLYDKHLYIFLSNLTNKNEGILEPKANKDINLDNKSNNLNNGLSIYGDGKIKMVTKKINKVNVTKKNIVENNIKSPKIINYISAISKFNTDIVTYQNISYKFNKGNKITNTSVTNNITTFLEYSFTAMNSLISKPVFVITPNKVIIQLFFFLNNNNFKSSNSLNYSKFLSINKTKLELLCLHLSKFFNKPVELELDRLYKPYHDSKILSNLIGILTKTIKLRYIIRKILIASKLDNPKNMENNLKKINNDNNRKNSFISGLNVRVAGRLLSQRVIPRMSVKTIQRGTLARGKTSLVNKATFTDKNKRGAYSITVTLGHVFF